MSEHAAAYEHQHTFTRAGYGTRDSKRRCMRCGTFTPGMPLCDECTGYIMKEAAERRWRMQLIFHSIIFMGILIYYFVL